VVSQLRGDEVDEEAVGAGDGFGELAVEGEGAVGPAALAEADGDEATALGELGGGFGAPGIMRVGEGGVVVVPGSEEAVAALCDPVVEVGGGDLVGGGEEGTGGGEELDGGGFVYDFFGAADVEGVGGVGGGEVGALVLDQDVAAVAGECEEGLGGGAVAVGVGGVGADAEDDRVEVGEVGGCEVGYGDHRRGKADGGEGFGNWVAGAGEVGDADVGWELEVDGDYAGGRWGVVVRVDEARVAYGAEAFGVGVVVGGLGGDVEDLRACDGRGRVEEEVDGVGACGFGFNGPVVGGLDVDVGGGGRVGAQGCG